MLAACCYTLTPPLVQRLLPLALCVFHSPLLYPKRSSVVGWGEWVGCPVGPGWAGLGWAGNLFEAAGWLAAAPGLTIGLVKWAPPLSLLDQGLRVSGLSLHKTLHLSTLV